jgi:hypothetical protein
MRLVARTLAATFALSCSAGAQWTTECVHHTSRLVTCRTVHEPTPARAPRDSRVHDAARSLSAAPAEQSVDVLGVWRATGVRFESDGRSTALEVRVTPRSRGIRLETPGALGIPGGSVFDLQPVTPTMFRGTDRAGRVTTFRVDGPRRAELSLTGAGRSGVVTYQFDEHERPR